MKIHQRFKLVKFLEGSLIPIDGNFLSTSDALQSEHAAEAGEYAVVPIHVLEEEEEQEETAGDAPDEVEQAKKLLQEKGFSVNQPGSDKSNNKGNAKKKNAQRSKAGKK